MDSVRGLAFDEAALLARLNPLDDATLDALGMGVIGFDVEGRVQRYNAFEARFSGLRVADVLGRPLFTEIAQCMNNYLVAQRFEDALAAGAELDATIDYVLTWRMRPTRVRLRLLQAPAQPLRYVVLQHGGPVAAA
jgi:photoactive yellow protein